MAESASGTAKIREGVRLLRTLRGERGAIGRVAWSAQLNLIASPEGAGKIRLWNPNTGAFTDLRHKGVLSVAFHPQGRILASAADKGDVRLWDLSTDTTEDTTPTSILEGQTGWAVALAFNYTGDLLATGAMDGSIRLWDVASGTLVRKLDGHTAAITSLAFEPNGTILASAAFDRSINLWEALSGNLLRKMDAPADIQSLAFDPGGREVAGGGKDGSIRFWDPDTGGLLRSVEGHAGPIYCVAFSPQKGLLATKAGDNTVRVWSASGEKCLKVLEEAIGKEWIVGIAFHPQEPLLATVCSNPRARKKLDNLIHIWELTPEVLLGNPTHAVTYTSVKIVILGERHVGKTTLGRRLARSDSNVSASANTERHFWIIDELSETRDGTRSEVVLWDLPGEPDYRRLHSLSLGGADLGLVVFNPTRDEDPMQGAEYWVNELRSGHQNHACPVILVAAKTDGKSHRVSKEQIAVFCEQYKPSTYCPTNAETGDGVENLMDLMKSLIRGRATPATVTTETFKRIKDFVLTEKTASRRAILTPGELRDRLQAIDSSWRFTDNEMLTAVGHLETQGYVTKLKSSRGEIRILLSPELLNTLAASFEMEARRDNRGLGLLDEERLLAGEYGFAELEPLSPEDRRILVDAVAALFVERNICRRDSSGLGSYLRFPGLVTRKEPASDGDVLLEEGVAIRVSGRTDHLFDVLTVQVAKTNFYERCDLFKRLARFHVRDGEFCVFRLEGERAEELDFVLSYGVNTRAPDRDIFKGLIQKYLGEKSLKFKSYEPVSCPGAEHPLSPSAVRELTKSGEPLEYCPRCGLEIRMPQVHRQGNMTLQQGSTVDEVDDRGNFEGVLQDFFRLRTGLESRETPPDCFISYAWGDAELKRWIIENLDRDLTRAGIKVILDEWDALAGDDLTRYEELIDKCSDVVLVGTIDYLRKYESPDWTEIKREVTLISVRKKAGKNVFPLLLDGTPPTAFPSFMRDNVYIDFKTKEDYFLRVFELIIRLYKIHPKDEMVQDVKRKLERLVRAIKIRSEANRQIPPKPANLPRHR